MRRLGMMPTVEEFRSMVVTLPHSENRPSVMMAQIINSAMNTNTMLYLLQIRLATSANVRCSFSMVFINVSSKY